MNCPKCGNPVVQNMKFCTKCGTPVPQQPVRPVSPQNNPPKVQPAQRPQPVQQKVEKTKEFLQYANPNVKQPQITPQNVVVQQPKKQKDEKKKKSKKNLPLIIIAVVLAIAVAVSGCVVGVDIFKNSKEKEGALYIDEFPVLKQETEFMVYDAEKFPAEEYEIKVERMMLGGILKSEAFRGETIVEDTSTEHVYNIDFDKDGDYRITITDITPDNTQTTLTTTDSGASDTTTITIIIDVKVDDDDPEALDKVDIDSVPGDKKSDDEAETDSEFIEATQDDFLELEKMLSSTRGTFSGGEAKLKTTEDFAEMLFYTYGQAYAYFYGEIDFSTEIKDENGYNHWYAKVPKENVKWICENVYNIEFDEHFKLDWEYTEATVYIEGDYCYIAEFTAGDWGIQDYITRQHKIVDGKYEIILDAYISGYVGGARDGDNESYKDDHILKVTASVKTDNGKRYWSLYKVEKLDPDYTEPTNSDSTPTTEVTTTTTTAKKLSADDIASVYMKNKSVWYKDYDNFVKDGYSSCYVFVDLDFDGIPELMTTGVAGSGVYSSNKFYKLNSTKDGVEEITYTADSEESYDFIASEEFPKLLRNKQNGKYVYWCHDVCSAGAAFGHGTTHGMLEYSGGKVTQNDMFNSGVVREGGAERDYFNVITGSNYKKVSESEYNKSYDSFMSDYENADLKLTFVYANEFAGASASQQKEYFKSSIKGFGFDGYVSQVQ